MKPNTGKLHGSSMAVAVLLAFTFAAGAQNRPGAKNAQSSANAPAGVKLQPMNVKPGLWETTSTIALKGEMPIPAEMLNRMTPDQRARMEARMKANSAGHTSTSTRKSCVTKEDVEKYKSDFGASRDGCTSTILSSTSTSAKAKMSCDIQGMTGTGTYEVEALDSGHVKGTSHATMTANGHTRTVDGTFDSKWLATSCGDVK